MCAFFWNFDHLNINFRFQSSSLPLPSFISFFLQALIHGLLWWWASSRLIFSLKWRLLSLFVSPFRCHSSSKKQRNPLMKKILGLQAPMELTSCGIRASSSRWCSFASSIFLFGEFSLIPCSSSYSPCISSIVLWFGAV